MDNYDISKWEMRYYWFLTKIDSIKRFFKRFTKKGRQELAYEKMRFDQIHEMILNYNTNEQE